MTLDLMKADIEKRVEEGQKRTKLIRESFQSSVVSSLLFGKIQGPFHACSILAWSHIAHLANVPYIPVNIVAHISIEDVWAHLDNGVVSETGQINIKTAQDYSASGGFWRTDLCAGEDVKYFRSEGKDLPSIIPFYLDDSRIMDIHAYMPHITVVGRPRIDPMIVGGYPLEFRVFIGGNIPKDYAVSFYYPQASDFTVTPELERLMDTSVEYAQKINKKRVELGLIPWLPEQGFPDELRGSTLDFMVTSEGQVVLVDAGPGYGSGAHPCCFLDTIVQGRKWHPNENVTIR